MTADRLDEVVGGDSEVPAGDSPGETSEAASFTSPRIEALAALELTPRRVEVRRVAQAMRDIIESLVSSTAWQ